MGQVIVVRTGVADIRRAGRHVAPGHIHTSAEASGLITGSRRGPWGLGAAWSGEVFKSEITGSPVAAIEWLQSLPEAGAGGE